MIELLAKSFIKDHKNYASPEVREKGEAMIARLLHTVPNEKARSTAQKFLEAIDEGKRDFRF
jgi:2-iminoacetate synthase